MVHSLEIELLGPLRAGYGTGVIAIGSPGQQAIFSALALRANSVVSQAELIHAVWGEDAPASARGSVHTYISGLRRAFREQLSERDGPEQVILSSGSGYSLRVAGDCIDVRVFEHLRDRAQDQRAHGHVEAEVNLLQSALDLWHGQALSGIPGPYAASQRLRLSELQAITLERRSEARLELGAHSEAATELLDLVTTYPTRETLRRLLMLALYRSGRPTEALEVYRVARRDMIEDAGIEPGPDIRILQQKILANDPSLQNLFPPPSSLLPFVAAENHPVLTVVPPGVSKKWNSSPALFLGRHKEIAMLRGAVGALMSGQGQAIWIEGEAGIGKSELLAIGLSGVQTFRCHVAWAVADELGRNFPFQVLLEAFGSLSSPPQSRLAQLSETVRRSASGPRYGQSSATAYFAIDQLMALVAELCAEAALVIIMDDLQWVDDASILALHCLARATRHLPLLLVSASRSTSKRPSLLQLRHSYEAGGDTAVELTALSKVDANDLVFSIVGALPGPGLQRLADQAKGNPLYLQELLDSLLSSGHLALRDGLAEIEVSVGARAPTTLISAMNQRLAQLSLPAREMLRVAAVLGVEFSVTDVASALRRSAAALMDSIDEAVGTAVLVEADSRLAFRHPMIRQAVYEGMPLALRMALHREAGEALARAGAPLDRVAQLLAAPVTVDQWVVDWVVDHRIQLILRAPRVALDLIEAVQKEHVLAASHWEELSASRAAVLFRLGQNPGVPARAVLAQTRQPDRGAEMRFYLATVLYNEGHVDLAVASLREVVTDREMSDSWRARLQSLLAGYLCYGLNDLAAAGVMAGEAIVLAANADDLSAGADALQIMWYISSVRRDHIQALWYIDEAIKVLAGASEFLELRLHILESRMFSLQNLDRLSDATLTLNAAHRLDTHDQLSATFDVPAAVHYYWTGQWDEALASLKSRLEMTYVGFRNQTSPMLLCHGIAALIAVHRGDSHSASVHLDAADNYPLELNAARENCDFLLIAQALTKVESGHDRDALTVLDPIVNVGYAPMMLRHQWLPELTKIALRVGDRDRAQAALAVCVSEAELESPPARAYTATMRCRGLIEQDVTLLLEAADRYRRVGRRIELAQTLEDAAEILARSDQAAARRAFVDAIEVYRGLGARLDVTRNEQRLAQLDLTLNPNDRNGLPYASADPENR